MYVRAHKLFEYLVAGVEAKPEASLVSSLAEPPRLGDFLDALDPDLMLEWSGQDFQGLPSLREKILQRTGTGGTCSLEDVLVTAGTAEANFLAISQLVQPGDELVVDAPGWPQPLVLGEAIGANVKRLQRYEDRRWRFDLDQLEELVTPRTKLIFLCNPNNPTGQTVSEDELKRAVAIAERVGAYLLCDEVYSEMEWEVDPIPRVANYYHRGISTGSVSKVLGLQGLRTGWLICRDPKLVNDAVVLREDTSEIMNIMGEVIADAALDDTHYGPAIDKARKAGQRNLERLDRFIASRPELDWHRPPAGLIGFCRLELGINSEAFADRLLSPPYRTLVVPGTAYDCPHHIRLGAGGGEAASLDTGLERLGRFLDTLKAK